MINVFYDCYRVLGRVYRDGAYLKQALQRESLEPINKSLTVKICYGVLDKDISLNYLISSLTEKNPKSQIKLIIKIGAYCIRYLSKTPHAVTDAAVELCKKLGKSGASGFVNAILRKVATYEPKLPEDKAEMLSVKYSFPLFAVEQLLRDYGEEQTIKIISYDTPHTFLRFSDDNGGAFFEERNIEYEKTPFNRVFSLKRFVRDDSSFYRGEYTFQSIGSVAICDVVESGNNLLDCCAAPGGKSVLLSEKFNSVTSCDLHEMRVELIKSYAERMKKDNIKAFVCDATAFNAEFEGKFDAVLCDSPCSSLGVTVENPDVKINRTETNIKELAQIQGKILRNCSKYVKNGGCLYYSTCSVLKIENQYAVKDFLSSEEGKQFRVETTTSPLECIDTGYGLQFLPHISCGAGFFVCKMRKL